MKFLLKEFNDVRRFRGADAANMQVIEDDGTEVYLWMNQSHIEANVRDFGPHPDLLLAFKMYGRSPEKLVAEWRRSDNGRWLRPVEAQRCSLGYYTHVDYPVPITDEAFNSWAAMVGLQCYVEWMDSDEDAEEVTERYGKGDNDILAWEPKRPEGDGWFIGSIHETDGDGPVCVWLRHASAEA